MTEPQLSSNTAPLYPASASTGPSSPAPVRWGGVVWGILLTLFAAGTLFVLSSSERTANVASWLGSLTAPSAWALGAALLGLVIVVSALLGGIRSAQRRRVRL
ncbi:hypothetical protein AB4Z18_15330 [Leifsonia sp. 2TAF2]|uniref:hypothetical protein n=1 Tax=Leifsonia sp. 2TAF2 TaxID=3233009 RepID=UPI003F9C459D